jgi:hypothetical protein
VPVACCVLVLLGLGRAQLQRQSFGHCEAAAGDMEAKSAAAAAAAKAGVVVSEEEQREQELVSARSAGLRPWLCSGGVLCLLRAVC